MVSEDNTVTAGRVLVIDDDRMSRRCLIAFLERAGYKVVESQGADHALSLFDTGQETVRGFDCIITDYRMPEKDGLWMLTWLQSNAPETAAIMVTAEGEKELVMASLRQGACDFLDKPIEAKSLLAAVRKASLNTQKARGLARAASDVLAVGRVQQQMVGGAIPNCGLAVELCYHPSHEAGGDYLSVFPLGEDRFLVLATDVSGHDLRAAYLSAYFQGFVSGMIEAHTPIQEVLSRFNHYLVSDSNGRSGAIWKTEITTSVAVCALLLDRRSSTARCLSCGFPMPVYSDGKSQLSVLGEVWSSPLGWFPDSVEQPLDVTISADGRFYLWTDGLEDLAVHLGVCPLSCAFGLMLARRQGSSPLWMKRALDDVLFACVHIKPPGAGASGFYPLYHSRHAGAEESRIDELQEYWTRSLRTAIPALSEGRMYDIVLCLREVALNALKHGCRSSAEEYATLLIECDPDTNQLRVVVSDPGPGHQFDVAAHLKLADEQMICEHRGLMLIEAMATKMVTKRNGAHVELEFDLKPDEQKARAA